MTTLSRVQALLTRSPGQAGSLRDVVEAEIRAKAHGDNAFHLNGRDILLSAKAVEVLALALHELATNAAKSGRGPMPRSSM